MKSNANPEAFDAIVLRARTVDEQENLVNEDSDDVEALPAIWSLAERLEAQGMPPKVFVVGRCRLLVVSEDESELAKACLLPDDFEGETFIRARLMTIEPNAAQVRGGDLVAVLVTPDSAVVYELLLDASEIPQLEAGAIPLVTLPHGEALLGLRADLGLISDSGLLLSAALQGEVQ